MTQIFCTQRLHKTNGYMRYSQNLQFLKALPGMTNNFSKSKLASKLSLKSSRTRADSFFHMYMVPQSFLNSPASQVKRIATRAISDSF